MLILIKIEKEMFFCIDYDYFKNQDMWTPEYYNPLYLNTIKAIREKNETVLLGDIADFKSGDEVGSVNYKDYLEKKDNDVPFIRTTDLVNYDIDQFPDYFIDNYIFQETSQNIKENEILFTKDGKIGLTAMITGSDKCILSSGILRIIPKNICPFYLFIILSIKEIGLYQARQRTVVASTIPHLREDRIHDFVIPILPNQEEIVSLTRQAFELKDKRKKLIKESIELLEKSFEEL